MSSASSHGNTGKQNRDGYAHIESVTVKQDIILHPFNIDFPACAVTAILGPSGSGKTTLMSVLTNNIPINMVACGVVHLPGFSSLVPQEDSLHGFFSCRGYLQHYGRLCGLPKIVANERIEGLLQKMGLTEIADKNVIVGDLFLKGLSGGQKKRLSIALECLSHPENLFLDEPTSGLDAESARQVMDFLRSYAREAPNRRVILTIHQPSSFIWQKIDNVVLLSKGKLMYQGPRTCMENFFVCVGFPTPLGWNPADHYITVVNDEFQDHKLTVDEWAMKYTEYKPHLDEENGAISKSMKTAASGEVLATHRSSNPITLAVELTRRYCINLALNIGILGTRIAMYVMLALMIGIFFWNGGHQYDFESVQSRAGVLFYCVCFFIFMSVAILPFTVMERSIVDKEVANHYYHPAYYQVSQAIASIPATALLAFLITIIIVPMVKLNDPLWYFLNMFLALFVAEALSYLVSHVVPHFVIGMALLASLYGFFMLIPGFLILPSDFPDWLQWLYYIGVHTYSWRSFMYGEFSDMDEITGNSKFKNGQDVLKFYEIDDVNRTHDMITLAGYGLFVHMLSFIVLHMRYRMFNSKLQLPVQHSK